MAHTDEKTRFSRALQNPSCHSFPPLRLLPAYKAIIPCASHYTPRKPIAFPAHHLATRIWTGTGFHLKEKQAIGTHLRTARSRFFQRHADKHKKSCADKKCFLSRTENHSAETESQIRSRNAKNKLKTGQRFNKSQNKRLHNHSIYLPLQDSVLTLCQPQSGLKDKIRGQPPKSGTTPTSHAEPGSADDLALRYPVFRS